MPGSSAVHPMIEKGPVQAPDDIVRTVDRLTRLATTGLVPMLDTEKRLFCYRFKKTENGLRQEGISPRYTMICLLGLHRLEQSGATSPIALTPILDGLLANLDWVDNIGDMGLLLWLCATVAPDRFADLEIRLKLETAFTRFQDARRGSTVELSWFLTGLSYGKLTSASKIPGVQNLAIETYRRLIRNQGEHDTFGYLDSQYGIAGMNRSRIGCFADQVYPIYALTRFSQAYGDSKPIQQALDCARRICEAQGPLGQWWWHYDFKTGGVVGRYPVFSVHQHGMAPMVLMALGEATHSDFSPWIQKGLRWINNNNELGVDMEDASAKVVWRCISPSKSKRLWKLATNLVAQREDQETRDNLSVLFECRPYELGWLLYAFAKWNRQWSSATVLKTT
jgi:hypothetical protein